MNTEHLISKSCLFEGDIPTDALPVWNGEGSGANSAGNKAGLEEQDRNMVDVEHHGVLCRGALHEVEGARDGEN